MSPPQPAGGARVFLAVGLLAALAGAALWRLNAEPEGPPPRLSAKALYSVAFQEPGGGPHSLNEFRGKLLVLNFWATWCPPCRAEMPGFSRLQSRWADRNVQFVGLTGDDPDKVERFLRARPVTYPVFLGGAVADDWARRLGDVEGGLPYTVILSPDGLVLHEKVGLYSEDRLDADLRRLAATSGKER